MERQERGMEKQEKETGRRIRRRDKVPVVYLSRQSGFFSSTV